MTTGYVDVTQEVESIREPVKKKRMGDLKPDFQAHLLCRKCNNLWPYCQNHLHRIMEPRKQHQGSFR